MATLVAPQRFVKTKLLEIKSIGVLYCAGTSKGNFVVWTLLELIRMHTFLSFLVVRDGQGEPAPTPDQSALARTSSNYRSVLITNLR
jgi:hypothetical protein